MLGRTARQIFVRLLAGTLVVALVAIVAVTMRSAVLDSGRDAAFWVWAERLSWVASLVAVSIAVYVTRKQIPEMNDSLRRMTVHPSLTAGFTPIDPESNQPAARTDVTVKAGAGPQLVKIPIAIANHGQAHAHQVRLTIVPPSGVSIVGEVGSPTADNPDRKVWTRTEAWARIDAGGFELVDVELTLRDLAQDLRIDMLWSAEETILERHERSIRVELS